MDFDRLLTNAHNENRQRHEKQRLLIEQQEKQKAATQKAQADELLDLITASAPELREFVDYLKFKMDGTMDEIRGVNKSEMCRLEGEGFILGRIKYDDDDGIWHGWELHLIKTHDSHYVAAFEMKSHSGHLKELGFVSFPAGVFASVESMATFVLVKFSNFIKYQEQYGRNVSRVAASEAPKRSWIGRLLWG